MKKRILVIDDEPDYTHLLRCSLECHGYYNVREENDPARAVDAAREFGPDLILLDVMMPGLDGSDVAARMRSHPALRDTPVIFVTALVSGDEAPNGSCDNGGHLLLPKSVPVLTLIECIEQKLADKSAALVA